MDSQPANSSDATFASSFKHTILDKEIYVGCPRKSFVIVHSDAAPIVSHPCIFVRTFVMECLVSSVSHKANSTQCQNLMDILSLFFKNNSKLSKCHKTYSRCSFKVCFRRIKMTTVIFTLPVKYQEGTIMHLPCQKDSLAS